VRGASDADTVEALIPYMESEHHPEGDVLFRAGDPPDKLYLIQSGRVVFPEIGKRLSAGELFGEVGLFAPQKVRTVTAICADDCRLAAGLDYRTPYALRHTFVSECIAAGIATFEIARMGGTSLLQIEKTYGHLLPDAIERGRAALEAFDATANDAFGQLSGSANWRSRDNEPPEKAL